MTRDRDQGSAAGLDDFEALLQPLWLRAQDGDEAAYRDALRHIATRLRGWLRRRMQTLPDEVEMKFPPFFTRPAA